MQQGLLYVAQTGGGPGERGVASGEAVMDPKVGPSALKAMQQGLRYVEQIGGVPVERCIASGEAVKGYIAALAKDVEAARLSVGESEAKQAPMLPVKALIATEIMVRGKDPRYLRAIAWLRMVGYWSGLRGDDGMGIVASSLIIGADGNLRGHASRTKVTGPGKAKVRREIFVAHDAYFLDPHWLVWVSIATSSSVSLRQICRV